MPYLTSLYRATSCEKEESSVEMKSTLCVNRLHFISWKTLEERARYANFRDLCKIEMSDGLAITDSPTISRVSRIFAMRTSQVDDINVRSDRLPRCRLHLWGKQATRDQEEERKKSCRLV